jgi:hypothetical protein
VLIDSDRYLLESGRRAGVDLAESWSLTLLHNVFAVTGTAGAAP